MNKQYNPLIFLAALGAGGISVFPFAFLQYVHPHGKGLVTAAEIFNSNHWPVWVYVILSAIMIVFAAIHFILLFQFLPQLFKFRKTEAYSELMDNPLANTAILAPFIAIVMSMNAFIGPIRFFVPLFSDNFQALMMPALVVWLIIGALLLHTEFALLITAFKKGFDVGKINFGWMLHSFALSMYTVTGTGIAALAKDSGIANLAAFVALITGTMGIFLFFVKIITIFQSHMAADNLPEKQFMPAFLIVIPNITLYAISLFRFGHFLEKQHGVHLDAYFLVVITVSYAFATWYMLFGLTLLKDFIKNDLFSKHYYVQLWGIICPFVAYAVLGSFVYKVFMPWEGFLIATLVSAFIAIGLFADLFIRHIRCIANSKSIAC